jgi:hypothetical protein
VRSSDSPRRLSLTALTGRPVRVPHQGRRAGWLRDLVVDLTRSPVPVTGVVVGDFQGRWSVPAEQVTVVPPDSVDLRDAGEQAHEPLAPAPHELLLVRDVLDTRVYDVARRRSVRVGDVWLDLAENGSLTVAGLELGPEAVLRRLGLRRRRAAPARLVPLSQVHLTSLHGHRVQLDTPTSSVHALEGPELAHLLTHLPMSSAADVARRLPADRVSRAVESLHPHLADRLGHALTDGEAPSSRRWRRTAGWRVYRPRDRGGRRRADPPAARP